VPLAPPEPALPVTCGTAGVGEAPLPGPFGGAEGGVPGGGGAVTMGGLRTGPLPGGMLGGGCLPLLPVLLGGRDAGGRLGAHTVAGICSVAGAVGSVAGGVAAVAGATLAIGRIGPCSEAETSGMASGGDPIG